MSTVGDIRYFSEKKMNTSIQQFYESLPAHLQKNFMNSFQFGIKLSPSISLAGYEGPASLCEAQSRLSKPIDIFDDISVIKHKWDWSEGKASSIFGRITNWMRTTEPSVWFVMIFDKETGLFLTSDYIKLAEMSTASGDKLFNELSCEEALRIYQRAYNLRTLYLPDTKDAVGSNNGLCFDAEIFRGNIKKAQIEIDALTKSKLGDVSLANKDFTKATEFYKLACKESKSELYAEGYKKKIDEANQKHICEKNNLGDSHFDKGEYKNALECYEAAYTMSDLDKDKYNSCIIKTKKELEAADWSTEGKALFEAGDFEGASGCFELAFFISKTARGKEAYAMDRDKCKTIHKGIVKIEGMFQDLHNCSDASQFKKNTIQLSKILDLSEHFIANFSSVERFKEFRTLVAYKFAQDEAACLTVDGDELFQLGLFTEACQKYEEAFRKFENNDGNIEKCRKEIQAIALNREGTLLYDKGEIHASVDKFQSAFDLSVFVKQKRIYKEHLRKAEATVNGITHLETLWFDGWNDSEIGEPEKAQFKFSKIFHDAKMLLKKYPVVTKFRDFQMNAIAKLEGDKLIFNAYQLHKYCVDLIDCGDFEMADKKIDEARGMFSSAIAKYKTGNDKNFMKSIKFAHGQLASLNEREEIVIAKKLSRLAAKNNNDVNHKV